MSKTKYLENDSMDSAKYISNAILYIQQQLKCIIGKAT